MLRMVSDENFNGEIVCGLFRAQPELDLVRIQDVGLCGADDPLILGWAAEHDRILLTHDRKTVPAFAYDRVRENEPMPGVIVVDNRVAIGRAIDEILLFSDFSEPGEWEGQVLYF